MSDNENNESNEDNTNNNEMPEDPDSNKSNAPNENNENNEPQVGNDPQDWVSDFDRLNNNPDLTEEMVKAELSAYQQALEAEFKLKTDVDPDNVNEYTQEFFKANAYSAAAQIVHLANFAESETVRASMSKYIVEAARDDEKGSENPLNAILEGLKKNDKNRQPANREEEN